MPAEVDFYKFRVPAGTTLKARLNSNIASNYNLDLREPNAVVPVFSARSLGLTETVNWKNASAPAVFVYARVNFVSGSVGTTSTCGLELAR